MSGRKRNKDHLREHAEVSLVEALAAPDFDDPLRWWTQHPTHATIVDLHCFAVGEAENPHPSGKTVGGWSGPFSGRPGLIRELATTLKARLMWAPKHTCEAYRYALRAWWRMFDWMEGQIMSDGTRIERLDSIAGLGDFHEVCAHRFVIGTNAFRFFLSIVNQARKYSGLPQLEWATPEADEPDRILITDAQARAVRSLIKGDWRAVLKRWRLRQTVMAEAASRSKAEPASNLGEEGEHLLRLWDDFCRIAQKTGEPLPIGKQLWDGRSQKKREQLNTSLAEMRSIPHPTAWDADVAFHLSLLGSGWNPSTLANLDAADPFLVSPSIKDAGYLVLKADDRDDGEVEIRAPKPRARGVLQRCSGLLKNACSPPSIVHEYRARSEPLRVILRQRLDSAVVEHKRLQVDGNEEERSANYKLVQALKRGVCSVWLFVNSGGQIRWLDERRFNKYLSKETSGEMTYLGLVVKRLADDRNERIDSFTRSDFRDLFARWAFAASGGSPIAVMLALGQVRLSSTQKYLANNLFRQENNDAARQFLDHLLAELEQGRIDLTILAQLCRHGSLSLKMEARLLEYRSLMRSRLGVACKDPRNPPDHIAPGHSNGRLCGTQRCTLDCRNARVLPESLDGLAMRAEELRVVAEHVPREAWLRGKFDDELIYTEELLARYFNHEKVASARGMWRDKLATGNHIVPGLLYDVGTVGVPK